MRCYDCREKVPEDRWELLQLRRCEACAIRVLEAEGRAIVQRWRELDESRPFPEEYE